jgi:hypothetical protein
MSSSQRSLHSGFAERRVAARPLGSGRVTEGNTSPEEHDRFAAEGINQRLAPSQFGAELGSGEGQQDVPR